MTNPPILSHGTWPESSRIASLLRKETVGGFLLIGAAVVALIWANSPWGDAYADLRDFEIGPESLHLHLSLGTWAADGLLAIFFFVAGLELKRELVAGDLRDPRRAAIPIVAAVGGMVMPAVIYVAINAASSTEGALRGWAIPTATDIAFALAVLAVLGSFLPTALRTFLLTLAIVDDLLAICIIAFFYTDHLEIVWLLAAIVPIAIFAVLVQRRVRHWYLLLPLAAVAWALVHASGIHATIAGVVLGFTVPVLRSKKAGGPEAGPGLAEWFEHQWRPISAGVAVPIFAFFAAGVDVGGLSGLAEANRSTITYGILLGLVVGKMLGVFGATWLMAKFTHANLDPSLAWVDVIGVALLAGIGFTVSLLIGELAFGNATEHDDYVKIGVLEGSLLAAILAAIVLRARNRVYRRIHVQETEDLDESGIPDIYEQD
ncbi:NhaA family Na+:H+ antiporter [Mumia flava]|uniref:Na(+)/H(+) antiporter NhaA n=1 Tax=Mumia flava TaxID=1348852 RepID=A0A0B2B1G2_9ACTN|nr:Na+/H+ antiporter NhaA [Mumia flava]PJJ58415.1 NhaA family Na+:H+ antiporter [Mumia flava]